LLLSWLYTYAALAISANQFGKFPVIIT
jgi:hypothetical protein